MFCQKSSLPLFGYPPTKDKNLNLNFLEFGTDILRTFLWLLTFHNPIV